MIEVTVLFKNQEQFDKFLKTNKVEEYTWKKGKITIDLSGSIKEAMEDLKTTETKAEEPVAQPSVTESMF